MKKYIKTFGERPEEILVRKTKVIFDQNGIAEVDDDVAEALEAIPGYNFVSEGESNGEGEKTPVDPPSEPVIEPSNEDEDPADEDPADEDESEGTSEDKQDEEDESPKPIKAPNKRRPALRK